MIHVVDEKTDKILTVLSQEDFYNDEYEENLKGVEKFKFFMSAMHSKAGFFASRRKIVIPGEDGEFKEFILQEPLLINNTKEIYTVASYTDLRKQKIIDPIVLEGQTAFTAGQFVLDLTKWQLGTVEFGGTKKVEFSEPLDAYEALWEVAKIFGLELRFRVEKKGSKIVGHYVDMVKRRGELSGKEVVFGKDIEGIERHETAGELVTALKCYGPVREDGSRLMVIVEDEEAFQRWNDDGAHLWGKYEPQTDNSEMTEERLRTLGEMELAKRISTQVQYKLSTIALEHIYGLEHEKVRLGDTNRVKDESKKPPIYLDARVISIRRSIKKSSRKIVEYGDFIEYTREEVMGEWKKLQAEFQRKLAQLMLVSITSSAGNIFKNGEGSTVLTVNTFLGGTEYDMNGTRYTYQWTKRDKDGNVDASFNKTGKSITVTSQDVSESAAFSVEVSMSGTVLQKSQITVTDVYDGEDGYTPIKGVDYFDGVDGQNGRDGSSAYIWVRYSESPDGNPMTTDSANAKYMGVATTSTPSPPSSYSSYKWSLVKGNDGLPGEPGPDGRTSYLHVKYSNDGGATFTTNNGESAGEWIGMYVDFTEADSNSPSSYTWNKVKGDKGDPGRDGIVNAVRKIRYIRDWINGSSANTSNIWVEIQAISGNVNRALGKTVTSSAAGTNLSRITDGDINSANFASVGTGDQWVRIDLGAVYEDIDYIQVWHYYADGRTFNKTKLEVSEDGVNWIPLFDSALTGTYKETSRGLTILVNPKIINEITALQIKSLNGLDVGNGQFVVDGNGLVTVGGRVFVTGPKGTVLIENDKVESSYNGWITRLTGAELESFIGAFSKAKINGNGLFMNKLDGDLKGGSVSHGTTNGVTHVDVFADNYIRFLAYGDEKARLIATGLSMLGDNIISTADRTWIAPTLLNGVSNYGGGYETAAYYKDALGHVHLRGFLTGSADGKHIFTLPAGYRPGALKTFSTWSNSSVGTSRISIATDGKVTATVSGNWLSLDGIYFLYAN
ncbi:phage tail protein [Cytobacillus oceanisediminis]|uniref:phage tail spike protein n=1 Tax=Cytobacillus oceanisediminis TaxID=665099 RepID=UPI001C231C61|nr:phage tail spike protein [Cytobacillus oceanisediminis]MBU8733430.1 phage tail protein [Cytobacillus oceanisediminis]